VLEGNVSLPLTKKMSVGMGAKLNSLNEQQTGVGGFVNGNIAADAHDKFSFHVEKGYLPGSGTAAKLVPNTMGTVSYLKIFK
jgi:hypothetical protein